MGAQLHVDSKDAARLSELTDKVWQRWRQGAAGRVRATGGREVAKRGRIG